MSTSTTVQPSDVPATASSKTVFFTGATGYIGGTVLTKLLAFPSPPKEIALLVRKQEQADALSAFKDLPSGVSLKPVLGSLDDADVLRKAASEADITVNCANADHLDAIKAILDGQRIRREKTGHRPLLVHTSGTGVLVDNAKGEYPNDKIYTDFAPAQATKSSPALLSIETLSDDAPHRPVDLEIVRADAAGYCKAYIILPSTIWGVGAGPLFDQSISNSFSDQMPTLCRIALDRGQAGMLGKGANIWPHVNINDLGDLYALVYNGAIRGDIGHGKNGYYFGAAGEYTLLSAAEAIGSALVENKFSKESQPTKLTEEEVQKYYGGVLYMGANSRARGVRSSSIGWRPKYTEQNDLLRHVKQELARVEKAFGKQFKA